MVGIKKLEQFLDTNDENTLIGIEPVDVGDISDSELIPFTQVLDFSFPKKSQAELITQIGQVSYVGDAVAKITGLDKIKIEDVINIRTTSGEQPALVLGIDRGIAETVVLGDYTKVKKGDQAYSTEQKLSIPVGEGLFGRVISPLGEPLDGKGALNFTTYRPIEFPGPPIMLREPIKDALATGIMVIDTTIPVGRGQRELVIGDRKSGKTRTVLDTISNQKGNNIECVYVGVGMQAAKAKEAVNLLEKRGAMEYTTVIMSFSDDPPTLQYLAPYTGVAIAEHLMYSGKHVLIVYDDLSKQAKAYRQVSLLLKRSPGRDAYPGDIFFLHSRLLERAAKLHRKLGGGSITALPVAQTIGGDVSEYIITNLMSITDGHIYLDWNMMNSGILPAVNSGLSVSRIGGAVQVPLHRKVGELASRQLARYNEVKSFETINTEVSEDTLRDIRRGKRVMEMFSQRSGFNISPDEQVIMMSLVTSGRIDTMELDEMPEFKEDFIKFYRSGDYTHLKDVTLRSKSIEELDPLLDKLIKDYQKNNSKYNSSIRPLNPTI